MSILETLVNIWTTITGKPYRTVNPSLKAESTSQPLTKTASLNESVFEDFKSHIKLREGQVIDKKTSKHRVYNDSLGKPTVGWGHLVLPSDNLKVGDLVDVKRIEEFFKKDSKSALDAAFKQAEDLGHKDNAQFIVALASVNYQLGINWPKTWVNTYAHIKAKRYNNAIKAIRGSLWARQTPTRTEDFIKALSKLNYSC